MPEPKWRAGDLHRERAMMLAAQDSASLNQFIVTAVAEKISALNTEAFFQQRAALSSRAKFDRVLAKVADRPPVPGDEVT